MEQSRLLACVVVITLTALPLPASAWNIPGHMLSGAIAYQVLQQESPTTINKVKAVLEKHPWYSNQWQTMALDVPVADIASCCSCRRQGGLTIFAPGTRLKVNRLGTTINIPFKPEGQSAGVQVREPEPVNILTALAENEGVVRNTSGNAERRAIALAWLFHLVGDIHQPLHAVQLFTNDYPNSDRGGNQICIRVTQTGQPMDLHRFWDGVITSSQNLTRLRNDATVLRNRQKFQRGQLSELASTDFESWAKESYESATKFSYLNGKLIGALRDGNKDCTMFTAAPVLPVGYIVNVSRIADRRMILAGYRVADLLTRLLGNQWEVERYSEPQSRPPVSR